MKKRLIIQILILFFTIILAIILFSQINLKVLLSLLFRIDPILLVTGFIIYGCSYLFRAFKFYVLLNKNIGLRDLFNLVCVTNLLNTVLPIRAGELSYIYFMRKKHNKGIGEGTATLFMARIFDFASIFLLFLFALTTKNAPEIIFKLIWPSGLFFGLIILILIFGGSLGKKILYIFKRISAFFKIDQNITIKRIFNQGEEFLKVVDNTTKTSIIKLFFISTFLWITTYLLWIMFVIGMGINLTIPEIMICISFFLIITTLPIQGILGFGTIEGALTIAFLLFGLSKDLAISLAFILHIIPLVYLIIFGVYGLISFNKEYFNKRK